MVLHQKTAKNKNRNLIAFRIPIELSVTLEKLGVNPKEACRQFLLQIATQNNIFTASFKIKPVLSPVSENQEDFWSLGRALNPRPPPYQGGALTGLGHRGASTPFYFLC